MDFRYQLTMKLLNFKQRSKFALNLHKYFFFSFWGVNEQIIDYRTVSKGPSTQIPDSGRNKFSSNVKLEFAVMIDNSTC